MTGHTGAAILAGRTYTLAVLVWRTPGSPVVAASPDGGETLGTPVSAVGSWQESRVTWEGTGNEVELGIAPLSATAGLVYIARSIVVEVPELDEPYLGAFFSGDTLGAWAGTPHGSPSVLMGSSPNGGLLDFGQSPRRAVATVRNLGTAPVWPVFTIQGGGFEEGFEVVEQETGATDRYAERVNDGEVLQIDTSINRVLGNGQNDLTGGLVRADNMVVAKQSSRTYKFRSLGAWSGTPRLTVTVKDAWF